MHLMLDYALAPEQDLSKTNNIGSPSPRQPMTWECGAQRCGLSGDPGSRPSNPNETKNETSQ